MPSMEMGDMGSPKLKVLAVLVIAGLFNLGYWYRLDHQSKAIAVHMKVAEANNRQLADVKAQVPGAPDPGQQLQAARGRD